MSALAAQPPSARGGKAGTGAAAAGKGIESTGGEAAAAASTPADAEPAAGTGAAQEPAPDGELDMELASFFGELEASGLLADAAAEAVAGAGAGPAPVADTATAPVPAAQAAASAGAPSSSQQPLLSVTPEPQPATSVDEAAGTHEASSGAVAADGAAAPGPAAGEAGPDGGGGGGEDDSEQQVLGYLQQDPQWCKCLDTTGGKVYFWNLGSGAVTWEAPEGLDGDLLVPPEADTADPMDGGAGQLDAAAAAGAAKDGPGEEGVAGAAAAAGPASQPSPTLVQQAALAAVPAAAAVTGAAGAGAGAAAAALLLLHAPQPHLDAVMASLEAEAAMAAAAFMHGLPPLVRLAVEAEVGRRAEGPAACWGWQSGPPGGCVACSCWGCPLGCPVWPALARKRRGCSAACNPTHPPLPALPARHQVRMSDWKALSAMQAGAVASGQPAEALSWPRYERHVMQRVKALLELLPQVWPRHARIWLTCVDSHQGQGCSCGRDVL